MGDISKNFDRSEFACSCGCHFNTVDAKLIEMVQAARERFGPIRINSACRCEAHNRKVGGAENSQHKLGRAADIVPLTQAVTIDRLFKFFDENYPNSGLGAYNTFLHVDSRGYKARW